MKQVLIPTDFSKNAWNATAYALNFLKDEECTFHFLHTYTPAFYRMDYVMGGPTFSAIPDASVERSLIGLEKVVERAKKEFSNPKHHYNTLSSFNTLTDEIKDVCKKRKIDLIVMGTQGATGATEIFLGTNTVYTLRKAVVPVLVIPEGYAYKSIKKILFPSDYWSDYKTEELQPLLDIAKELEAEITVFHVNEEYDMTDAQLKNQGFLEEKLTEVKHHFVLEKEQLMPNAVSHHIEEKQIGLLAMMNRKHSFFERLMVRQNVDVLGFHITIPFLVLPDTAPLNT